MSMASLRQIVPSKRYSPFSIYRYGPPGIDEAMYAVLSTTIVVVTCGPAFGFLVNATCGYFTKPLIGSSYRARISPCATKARSTISSSVQSAKPEIVTVEPSTARFAGPLARAWLKSMLAHESIHQRRENETSESAPCHLKTYQPVRAG